MNTNCASCTFYEGIVWKHNKRCPKYGMPQINTQCHECTWKDYDVIKHDNSSKHCILNNK